MDEQPSTVTLPLRELLRDSSRRATSMSLPLAVHRRLDVLAELATVVNASRAEIIGVLIAEADLDPDRLEQAVVRYRKKTVGEVVPEKPDTPREEHDDNLITFPVRKPGRPSHRAVY